MKNIQMHLTIGLDGGAEAVLVEIIRQAVGIDAGREARLKASQFANMGGQEMPTDRGLLIDIKAAAKLLDVCEKSIREMEKSGRMPRGIRLGRKAVRWSYEELRTWASEGCPKMAEWSGGGK